MITFLVISLLLIQNYFPLSTCFSTRKIIFRNFKCVYVSSASEHIPFDTGKKSLKISSKRTHLPRNLHKDIHFKRSKKTASEHEREREIFPIQSSKVLDKNEMQKPGSGSTELNDSLEPAHFFSMKSFEEIGMDAIMDSVVKELGLQKPSKIQNLAFRPILNGQNLVIAEQTGSGKTLAYLLPVMQKIITKMRNHVLTAAGPYHPYVVILSPTPELAEQISSVVRSLSNALKFRSACITSSSNMDNERKKLRLGAEVVVATPNKLLSLMKKYPTQSAPVLSLEDVQVLIADEVDALIHDDSFQLDSIIHKLSPLVQRIFVTSTLTNETLSLTSPIEALTEERESKRGGLTKPERGNAKKSDQMNSSKDKTAIAKSKPTITVPIGRLILHDDNQSTEDLEDETILVEDQLKFRLIKGPGLHRVAPTISFTSVIDCTNPVYYRLQDQPFRKHEIPSVIGPSSPENEPENESRFSSLNVLEGSEDRESHKTIGNSNINNKGEEAFVTTPGLLEWKARPNFYKTMSKSQSLEYITLNKCSHLVTIFNKELITLTRHSSVKGNQRKPTGMRTVIFCNSIPACRDVENFLARAGKKYSPLDVYSFHSAIDPVTRRENLLRFAADDVRPSVLISTDRASRGLDFGGQSINQIILFDFPKSPDELIRRVGRTGRVGRKGQVIILAYGRQVRLAKKIVSAIQQGIGAIPI